VEHPTLFVSATLDGQTPPSNAKEVAAGFPNATHVVVEGGSHQSTELDPPELTRRLADFLRGEATADTTFVLPFAFAAPESASSD
jgi:pimeloyl-ACP methyl ester carboxylesterase